MSSEQNKRRPGGPEKIFGENMPSWDDDESCSALFLHLVMYVSVGADRAKTSIKAKSAQFSQVSENDPGKTAHFVISASLPYSVTVDKVVGSQKISADEVILVVRILTLLTWQEKSFSFGVCQRNSVQIGITEGHWCK